MDPQRQDGARVWGAPITPRFPVRDSYTADQVAYLMALAYASGRQASFDDELADLYRGWYARRGWRRTARERMAERMAEMQDAQAAIDARLGRPAGYCYRGGPVEWDSAGVEMTP
jgi:hypothetical protein